LHKTNGQSEPSTDTASDDAVALSRCACLQPATSDSPSALQNSVRLTAKLEFLLHSTEIPDESPHRRECRRMGFCRTDQDVDSVPLSRRAERQLRPAVKHDEFGYRLRPSENAATRE